MKEGELKININLWNEEIKNPGLNINTEKTKVLKIEKDDNEEMDAKIGGVRIEQAKQFKYLSATIEKHQ